jgi:hypothetical protein
LEDSKKSMYVLELSVPPGGARKGLCFVYNNLEEIKQALETDLRMDLYYAEGLLYCYGKTGETVNLSTFIDSVEQQRLDLKPYITVQGEDGTEFTLTEDGLPSGIDETVVCDSGFLETAQATVDWSLLAVMPLSGDLLQPGEELELQTGHTEYPVLLRYGFNDLEEGTTPEEYAEAVAEFEAETS